MIALPVLSGFECLKILLKHGYYIRRQEGSHIIMRKDSLFSQIVVPNHKTLDKGNLRAIIRQSGLSIETFLGDG